MNQQTNSSNAKFKGKPRSGQPGDSPGTLRVGPEAIPTSISLIGYGSEGAEVEKFQSLAQMKSFHENHSMIWIRVEGLEVIKSLGSHFNLDDLTLEDILNQEPQSKFEDHGEYFFLTGQHLEAEHNLEDTPVNIVLGENWLISFSAHTIELLDRITFRIKSKRGKIRTMGPAYLAYAILDALIDHYFILIDQYGNRIENLEDCIYHPSDQSFFQQIRPLRTELMRFFRVVSSMRELVTNLQSGKNQVVFRDVIDFLKDCQDHTVHVLEQIEIYRQSSSDLMSIYHSNLGQKMNEIMKLLTIISTIFIPLSFIAALYGMNFNPEVSPWNMPELQWYYGYPFALIFMFFIAVLLTVFFIKKQWIAPHFFRRFRKRKTD